MEIEHLYLDNRALIEQIIGLVCRRNHASPADAEEFASAVHLHFIQDDYAVLRAFEGRGELGAFLQAVVRRLFQDWRNTNWGRWRPSAAARRLGPVAILLEMLLERDMHRLDQAVEMLRTNYGIADSAASLEALALQLPLRVRRSFTSDDALEAHVDDAASAETIVQAREIAARTVRVGSALQDAMRALTAQDQVILRMRCENDVPVTTISRVLGIEAQPLYRRITRLLAGVRTSIERAGISAADARDVVAQHGFDLLDEDTPVSARGSRPS